MKYVASWIPLDATDHPEGQTAKEAIASDRAPVDTGLVDHSGDRIYRLPEPMGFKVTKD